MTEVLTNYRLSRHCSSNFQNFSKAEYKVYRSGTCYVGNLSRNQRIGWGQLTWCNGSIYEGHFEENKKHGEGKYVLNDGSTYIGKFVNDKRHGHGELLWQNGEGYCGEFKEDKRDGYGIYKWPDGRQYEGSFENNMKSGYGVFHMSNGDRFEGIYKNDIRNGPGILHYESTGEKDIGIWKGSILIKICSHIKQSFQYKTFNNHYINAFKNCKDLSDNNDSNSCTSFSFDDLPNDSTDVFRKIICGCRESSSEKGFMEKNSEKLLQAASVGDYTTVKDILFNNFAHPDVTDRTGYSSVLAAAVNCHCEVLNCVLDSGANVNQLNMEGLSALSACHVLLYTEEKFIDNIAEATPTENLFNAVEVERRTGNIVVRNERKLIMSIYESTQKSLVAYKSLKRSTLTKSNLQSQQKQEYEQSRSTVKYENRNNNIRSSVNSSKFSYDFDSNSDINDYYDNPTNNEYDLWKMKFYQMSMDHVKDIEEINKNFKEFVSKNGKGYQTMNLNNNNKKINLTYLLQDKDRIYNAWEFTEPLKQHSTVAGTLGYDSPSTYRENKQVQGISNQILKKENVASEDKEKVIARKLNTERRPHLQNVVDLLLERGADPNASSLPMPVLFFAVKSADVNAVQILLERNANTTARINNKNLSALHIAVALPGTYGIEITKLLFKHGADPNLRDGFYNGRTPLHIVCCREDNYKDAQKICKLLLEHGGDPNLLCQGSSAISLAIASGNDLIIDLLLKYKANPSLKLSHGLGSILCVAVSFQAERRRGPSERMKMIDKLIKTGADVLAPVRISDKYPPGTVVDYAYHVFSQDRRIACTPYHALSSLERECYNARKTMLESLACHLRIAARKKEREIWEEDARKFDQGSSYILQSFSTSVNKNANRSRRLSRMNSGPGRDEICGLRFVTIKTSPRNISFVDKVGEKKCVAIDLIKRLRYCYECGRSIGVRLTACTRCNEVFYCSKPCKVKAWNERHRDECLKDKVNDFDDMKEVKQDEEQKKSSSKLTEDTNSFLPKLL